ncbi:MAG: thioredoxin family protein [Bacteroidetes bacterium]|nr:thioredoxin family protein [Bacteroidota bacterium]MBS1739228.1 thioredoxin family protein [Bacteroidota bacterium]MBS1775677.1 thioredoxin family protein [Bacteroidota bacterium]
MRIIFFRFSLLLTSLFFLASVVHAQSKKENGLVWYNDVNKANEVSLKTKKPIFAFFTGSDWCGWCHKLQREVFAKKEFENWAKKNVVLLEIDFPRNKKLPKEIVEQNASLQEAFKVQGYPTIWIFFLEKNAEKKFNISPLGSLGYPEGAEAGKEEVKFLANANAVLKKKKP